jgi:hypothetical protein
VSGFGTIEADDGAVYNAMASHVILRADSLLFVGERVSFSLCVISDDDQELSELVDIEPEDMEAGQD